MCRPRSFGSLPAARRRMYLQSLELIGFKSFAHKTVLNLHRGVTAIVGPNGCGKSNVLDAIRWVLGEQSAKALRGGEMADVIFSGTDSKSAVGLAEVSLTFAECEQELGIDYHEVRITRRVHRDGRSDYLLNGTSCRLKDIQLLFMDTGIGRSAYSIMEQGKIDLILSSRPEDRRAVFEEAAGITKYKAQKKEALRKLEGTEANLVRLTDIMKEVRRQIGSLQRQAGKARRYQGLWQEVRLLDLHLCRKQADEIGEWSARAEREAARLRAQGESLETELASKEGCLVEERRALEVLELRTLQARERLQDLKSQADAAEGRVGLNEERIAEAEALARRYAEDAAAAEEKIRVQRGQLAEADRRLAELAMSLQVEEERLRVEGEAVGALRARRLERERAAQEMQRQIGGRESRLAALRGELSNTLNGREAGETRLGLLQRELAQATLRRDELAAQAAATQDAAEAARARAEACRHDAQAAEHGLADAHRDLQAAERAWVAGQRGVAERESKLEVLRHLNEEGVGLGAGTEAVLRGLDDPQTHRAAIVGAVANFLEVPDDCIPAVEAALGQHLQAILVGDEGAAEAIAQSLARAGVGRAALLPKTSAPGDRPVEASLLPEGASGWLLDRVKVQGPVKALMHDLLGRVVLASDLETAFRLKRAAPHLPVVTLAGEYFAATGLVLAGRPVEANQSVFRRKLQIGALHAECVEAQRVVDEANERRGTATGRVEDAQSRLNQARDRAQRAQLETSSLHGQLSLLERELREGEGKLKSLVWEKENTEARLLKAAERVQVVQAELDVIVGESSRLQDEFSTCLAEVDALRAEEDDRAELLNEQKVQVATERHRRENVERERQPMAARLHELNELIAGRRREIAIYRQRVEALTAENERLRLQAVALTEHHATTAADVASLQAERTRRVEGVERAETDLRRLRKELSECQEARGREEVRGTQLALRLDRVREHAAQRYGTDLPGFAPDWPAFHAAVREAHERAAAAAAAEPAALAPPADPLDWTFVEKAVAEGTERLDAMGPVNLESIQEYDELEERARFLTAQHDDLTKSRTELLDAIGKINATTTELFAGTFAQVRQNFQEMFVELFGGGKADLLLVDADDPLESGIEIIAKPPGKQLQSVSLLSGGEKTMAAVALLFSIYMVKPSPFCVLDEMDAPLDESNITRFIKILDRFVSQSQFVVITHNKRTIAKADVLYGVTMEEHGISKLVGVRLTKRLEPGAQGELLDPDMVPTV